MTILAKIDERARAKASYDPPVRHKRYDKYGKEISKKRQRRVKAKNYIIESTRITKNGEPRKITFVARPQFVMLNHNFIRWPLARSEAFELKWKDSKKFINNQNYQYSTLLKDADGKAAVRLYFPASKISYGFHCMRAPRCSDMDLLFNLISATKIAKREHQHDIALYIGKKEMEKTWGPDRIEVGSAMYKGIVLDELDVGEVSLEFQSINAMLRWLGRTTNGNAHDILTQNIGYWLYNSVRFTHWVIQKQRPQIYKGCRMPGKWGGVISRGPKKFLPFIHSLKWKENRGPISITVSKQLLDTIDEGQYNRVKLPLPKRSERVCNLYLLAPLLANLPSNKLWKAETLCRRLGIRYDNNHTCRTHLKQTIDQVNRYRNTENQYWFKFYNDGKVGLYSSSPKHPDKAP